MERGGHPLSTSTRQQQHEELGRSEQTGTGNLKTVEGTPVNGEHRRIASRAGWQ